MTDTKWFSLGVKSTDKTLIFFILTIYHKIRKSYNILIIILSVDVTKSDYDVPKIEMDYYVTTPYKTKNTPHIMVGKDNETYFVKFNEKNNNRIGINELVCNLIGLKLELPLFEPIIAIISEELIKNNDQLKEFPEGEHFAQKYLEPFDTVATYMSQGRNLTEELIANVRHVPDFLIFDKFVENYDRHQGNICLLPSIALPNKVDYHLFDHDLAFQRDIVHNGSIKQIRQFQRQLEHVFFLVEGVTKRRLFDRISNKINFVKSDIPDIIKSIPSTWVTDNRDYINEIEEVLNDFTDRTVDSYLEFNKDKFPFYNK